jgi:hypothetical protein
LSPQQLTWEMVLQHCPSQCHSHSLQQWTGAGGSIAAPDHEYPSHLELRLTATDSSGKATTVTRRLDPRTVTVTVTSRPSGLQLSLGSRTATTPFSATLIVGATTGVSAPTPQTLAGGSYAFARWSDGGARVHDLRVGETSTTLSATYNATACAVGQYRGWYYNNPTLSGTPVALVCESAPLNRDWGSGPPPGLGVPADNFSVRWTGTFVFPAGSRTFTGTSDDGMRVWLDGSLIINRWTAVGTTRATRTVTSGQHAIRVEYHEAAGLAYARLTW